jgi:site-specific DNA recombinase
VTPDLHGPTAAVGYVRRSKESGKRTVSLEDQRERIAAYCERKGWRLAEVLVDDGVSGGRRERLTRLDAALRATRAGAVVVYHLDRLARDAAALLDWLERAGRRGVELHVVDRGRVEAESASGYLMAGIEGIVAAHYRKVISEKTRHALARLRTNGRRLSRWALRLPGCPGRAPSAGTREQAVLSRIASLHRDGLSLRAIARELAAEGSIARGGRPFAPSTVAAVLSRAVRLGSADASPSS